MGTESYIHNTFNMAISVYLSRNSHSVWKWDSDRTYFQRAGVIIPAFIFCRSDDVVIPKKCQFSEADVRFDISVLALHYLRYILLLKSAITITVWKPNFLFILGFNIVPKLCRSQRGGEALLHNGFAYCKHISNNTTTYYLRCSSYQRGCRARAPTKVVNGTIRMKLTQINHSHSDVVNMKIWNIKN